MSGVPASAIAERYGLSARHWTRLAAEGKIPGAWQPAGTGGRWLFDPVEFAAWKAAQQKEEPPWQGSTNAAAYTGRGHNVTALNAGNPLRQQIDVMLSAAIGDGSKGLTRSRGATGRGGRSQKPSNASSASTARR